MTTRRPAFALALSALTATAFGQLCPVVYEGSPALPTGETFGAVLTALGDLDGDGTLEVMAGPLQGQPGNTFHVYSLASAPHVEPGTIVASRQYALPAGVTPGTGGLFASSMALLGDIGSDGSIEVAVGAPGEDQGTGTVYIFSVDPITFDFLMTTRIAGIQMGLSAGDAFGSALAGLPDLLGGKTPELVVGAPGCDDGGTDNGSLWVLDLDSSASVTSSHELTATSVLPPGMQISGAFGSSLANLAADGHSSDLDGDGVSDLVVGAPAAGSAGGFWVLFLNTNATLSAATYIEAGSSGFVGPLAAGANFASALVTLSASTSGSERILAIAAPGAGSWASEQGELWYLRIGSTAHVFEELNVSVDSGGFMGFVLGGDHFGSALTSLGDLDGNGANDLLVGAPGGVGTSGPPLWSLFHASVLVPRSMSFAEENPATLAIASGEARLGTQMIVELDDTSGTLSSGTTQLYSGPSPTSVAPSGIPVSGVQGLLLVDLASAVSVSGPAWQSASPSSIPLDFPLDPALAGTSHFVQGLISAATTSLFSNGQRLVLSF